MKGILFISVVGQCTLALVDKPESYPDWKQWKNEDDVISLMNTVKNLSFSKPVQNVDQLRASQTSKSWQASW